MNNSKTLQKGMTMISLAALIIVVVFFLTLGIKLVPVYLEHFNVVQSMKSVKEEVHSGLAVGEIISMLNNRLSMNDVTSVKKQNITVDRQAKGSVVTVAYEVRRHALGNIDVVVSFKDSIEL
jgi:hypothetical protein